MDKNSVWFLIKFSGISIVFASIFLSRSEGWNINIIGLGFMGLCMWTGGIIYFERVKRAMKR